MLNKIESKNEREEEKYFPKITTINTNERKACRGESASIQSSRYWDRNIPKQSSCLHYNIMTETYLSKMILQPIGNSGSFLSKKP